jgi:hypothetical protein
MEIRLLGANGRTVGQTEMTKIVISFRNFANATRNYLSCRDCNDTHAYIVPTWVTS